MNIFLYNNEKQELSTVTAEQFLRNHTPEITAYFTQIKSEVDATKLSVEMEKNPVEFAAVKSEITKARAAVEAKVQQEPNEEPIEEPIEG